tara:strand:+ start:689 stop:970 length:282 start_codon:yes stop_codon:yes gene_type:complete
MNEVLNCDAKGCGHVEDVGEITADMVDTPCPVCGANLLTNEDWVAWQPYSAVLAAVTDMVGPEAAGEKVDLRVSLHGLKTSIEIKRKPNIKKD